jgi:dephospho-CoA kinase
MDIWGISGLGGTGKSVATQYLASKGFPTLDIDGLTRQLVDRNTELGKQGFVAIYKIFGDSVLDRQRNLDRSALRKRMFTNPEDKLKLEAALDPIVIEHVEKEAKRRAEMGTKLFVIEGARLAEAGFHKLVKGLIRVDASVEKRVTRVAKRDSMGKLEVEQMFRIQDQEGILRKVAKVTWTNEASTKALEKTIDAWLEEHRYRP